MLLVVKTCLPITGFRAAEGGKDGFSLSGVLPDISILAHDYKVNISRVLCVVVAVVHVW